MISNKVLLVASAIIICLSEAFGWGIDQVVCNFPETQSSPSIVYASNGDIYAAFHDFSAGSPPQRILVYKLPSGGYNWTQWGAPIEFGDINSNPSIVIGQDYVFVGYERNYPGGGMSVGVSRRALDNTGNWGFKVLAWGTEGAWWQGVDLAVDVESSYRIYAVYYEMNTHEVRFEYSDDDGQSWPDEHQQTLSLSGITPQIAYGESGSNKLVAIWCDAGNRYFYRKFSNNDGVSWSNQSEISSTPVDDFYNVTLEGSHTDNPGLGTFIVAYLIGSWPEYNEIHYSHSQSGGEGWNIGEPPIFTGLNNARLVSLCTDSNNEYHMAFFENDRVCYCCTETSDPSNWVDYYEVVSDEDNLSPNPMTAIAAGIDLTIIWSGNVGSGSLSDIFCDVGPINSVLEYPVSIRPMSYGISYAYPNPFNPTTTFRYSLPAASYIRLSVLDCQGKTVTEFINGYRYAGLYELRWDATGFPSGIYYARLQAGSFQATQKLVLLK